MSDRESSSLGNGLALAGAGSILLSLWQPWYSFRIPGFVLDQAAQSASQFGVLGPVIARGAAYLRGVGPVHLTSWQVMTGSPALLLGLAVLAGAGALLGLAGRVSGGAPVLRWCALAAMAIAGYELLHPPGTGGLLHPARGAWIALAGGVALLLGSMTGARTPRAAL